MTFSIDLLETTEQLREILPEWLAFLETKPLGMSVYNDLRFILAHWRSLSDEADAKLHILILREVGIIRCIAPFWMSKSIFKLSVSVKTLFSAKGIRQLKCFGDSFIYFCPDEGEKRHTERYFKFVFDHLAKTDIRFDFLYIMDLRKNTPFGEYCCNFRTTGKFRIVDVLVEKQRDYRIILPETMAGFLASLSQKKRYSIKRTVKNFHFDSAKDRFICIASPDQVEYFVDAMDRIAKESWQSKTFGHSQRNTDRSLAYFQELAESGLLRSYLLERDGIPIAYRNGYQDSTGYYCQESRYDRTHYEDLYPGLVCLFFHIENLFEKNRPAFVDFGFGDLGYKRVWANEEIESTSVYITATWKGYFLARTQKAINHFVFWCKRQLEYWKVADRIRKILQHKNRPR